LTTSGAQCRRTARPGSEWCGLHDPDSDAAQRRVETSRRLGPVLGMKGRARTITPPSPTAPHAPGGRKYERIPIDQ
jgi:hypothetical protein